jgi:negative regulator of sigma-B (phosphoserine phosphatase)
VIEWGVAGRPKEGESESGDQYVVRLSDHAALVAIIDGLGHGAEAATAALVAARLLEAGSGQAVESLLQQCHDALRSLRGVALGIVTIDAPRQQLCWTGIGNIEAMLLRADPMGRDRVERFVPRAGIVGHRLPPLRMDRRALMTDDLIILATDGIRQDFSASPRVGASCQALADSILGQFGKASDDALVLVLRYRGERP